MPALGPVWPTPSKAYPGAPAAIGPSPLGEAARALRGRGRLFALGGVEDEGRARAAVQAGAHAVAVIRAVLAAEDPGAASAALCAAVEGARAG